MDSGLTYDILGGGRIERDDDARTTKIYGFSYGFLWKYEPQHSISAKVVVERFPDYAITTGNEGYSPFCAIPSCEAQGYFICTRYIVFPFSFHPFDSIVQRLILSHFSTNRACDGKFQQYW